ncbi:MAG: adenylyltransferase, partial [Acidobacteria bacterium]|nr:adenylyltransferase [Acidobacteriota bacterium]
MNHLIAPHGGDLVDLQVSPERVRELKEASRDWPSIDLSPRQLNDLELLVNGAFSPLTGFLNRADYDSVLANMRLADGTLWPIPVNLEVSEGIAKGLESGSKLALRDPEGVMLAVLHVGDVWLPDREAEARQVYGTTSERHPEVARLRSREGQYYVGGRVESLQPPVNYDFRILRHTPAELRAEFTKLGWRKVVAFQTRNP